MLDPAWQSPYAPSATERHVNQHVARAFFLRRKIPHVIIVGVAALVLIAGVFVVPWLPAVGVAMVLLYAWDLHRSLVKFEKSGESLGTAMLDHFTPSGTTKDRERLITVLDRLAATFGVDSVSAVVVADPGYNAALVPNGTGLSFIVTDALMRDFELIELEGVVAHCLARHRLGLLNRESVAAVASINDNARQVLAGPGNAYRADEVAAAAIRYPLGLAGALHKCSRQVIPSTSFFVSETYAKWRWIWFDIWSDRSERDLSDLDDVELRARALEEW